MSGTVLPTSPAPDVQGAAGEHSPSGSKARDKPGYSEFDTVSRQEQKRLERREAAERSADARPHPHNDTERPREPSAQGETSPLSPEDAKKTTVADQSAINDSGGAGETTTDQPQGNELFDGAEVVFTFADLQALAAPSDGPLRGSGPLPDAGVQPGVTISGQLGTGNGALTDVLKGLVPGLAGHAPGAGKTTTESTPRVMDSLLGQLSPDGGKLPDQSAAATVSRFQGALDIASQPLTTTPGQKGLEMSVPLRGYATSIELPVGHAEWGDKLVGKLTWLTTQNMSVAEIHLTPPDMGPLEVRVQVQHDQAAVTVHATNSAVRDQLELHGHRLRDLLAEQGLELEHFDVTDASDQSAGSNADGQDGESNPAVGTLTDGGDTDGLERMETIDLGWKGELDLYA